MSTHFFTLTTRGLETVSADEMASLPGVKVSEVSYRRVAGVVEGLPLSLLRFRTVDDVYVDVATWQGVGHTRDMLGVIERWSAALDLTGAMQVCAEVRVIRPNPLFSVTASFVGRRNYSSEDIKAAVSDGIRASYALWKYTADDRDADFNARVFIEHDVAYVGLRLSRTPLHERGYKQAQRPGSLKPSVAAALLRLAEVEPGMRLLDPCCGAGTILIEGAILGAVAVGGDIDREALAAARGNADAAESTPPPDRVRVPIHGEEEKRPAIFVERWDARALPLADGSAERIVTNLPWGRQIQVDDALENFYRDVCAEIERVLMPGGRVVVLTSTPDLLAIKKLRRETPIEISLFGQRPTIGVYAATR